MLYTYYVEYLYHLLTYICNYTSLLSFLNPYEVFYKLQTQYIIRVLKEIEWIIWFLFCSINLFMKTLLIQIFEIFLILFDLPVIKCQFLIPFKVHILLYYNI